MELASKLSALPFTGNRVLRSAWIFQGCRARIFEEIRRCATQLAVPRHSFVFRPDDKCTGLYIVVSGQIKLVGTPTDGAEKVFALLRRGDWFGETALILRERHALGAKTTDAATMLLHLPETIMLDCLDHDHALALRFLAATCARFRSTMLDSQLLGTSARSRVVAFLRELIPARLTTGPITISLPVPKRTIASRLNLSPEHLSRVFRELANADLINFEGLEVFIPDVARIHEETLMRRERPAKPHRRRL
jgi:CRP/FNR family transcriptional regulator, dissimilatory nitrate respiration regulator